MDISASPDGAFVCYIHKTSKSRGIFFGENPFQSATPILLVQLCLSSLLTALFQYVLTPLGEASFISQTLAGIVLGPSLIGKSKFFSELVFPAQSLYVTQTFALFGLMLFLFLVGVKMDISTVTKSGRRAVVIGMSSFFCPLLLNIGVSFVLMRLIPMDTSLHNSLTWVGSFHSLSSFHVIACFLTDLKLLNSELGRLAISSSMISGICTWFWTIIVFTVTQSTFGHQDTAILLCLLVGSMMLVVIYILRPIMYWMARRTSHEKAVSESHIFGIFVMLLSCSIFSEIIGQHFLFGPMVLGLVVPDGPPLGSALVTKLDSFVSSMLLPIYFVVSGTSIDFSGIHFRNLIIVEILAVFGFLWKVVGTMLPSIYCKMPVNDALALGLILSVQGITDVVLLRRANELKIIDKEAYSIMVISIVVFSGIISPIVKILYKPSRRYMAYRRRTIQHARPNVELRMLTCIYHPEHTPCIVNLLNITNPTPKSPICFYVLHLIELIGRAAPLLVAHHPGKKNSSNLHQSDHIINAFRAYEQENSGSVMVNLFTGISPYASMHDEVCALAVDKRVSMVIIPFHRTWTLSETDDSSNAFRAVNRNILRKAPCSVGILVNRGTLTDATRSLTGETLYTIGMIFMGGHDDQEALAYAIRMAKHPDVHLTVIRFVEANRKRRSVDFEHEHEMINEFRTQNLNNGSCIYKEEVVKDSVAVISAIQAIENSFDLILVGRRHSTESEQLCLGLSEWNEFPELGYIGDMFASSDSNCKVSVLVVQQQAYAGTDMPDSPKTLVEESSTVVDMSWDNARLRGSNH